MRVGILTSGGDCQGLNGAMYGLVKALNFNCKEKLEIYGILEGYTGSVSYTHLIYFCQYKFQEQYN